MGIGGRSKGWPSLGVDGLQVATRGALVPLQNASPIAQNVSTVSAICSSHISQLVTGEGEHVLPIFTFHRLIRSTSKYNNVGTVGTQRREEFSRTEVREGLLAEVTFMFRVGNMRIPSPGEERKNE